MALTRITKGVIKPNENYDTHNINSTGIITAVGGDFSGNVSVGGVLTYEDVTSIDSVGLITARGGIDCNGDIDVDGHTNLDNISVAGVTTFSNTVHVGTAITFETNGQGNFSGIVTSRGYEVSYSDGPVTYNYFKAGRIRIFDNGSHCHFRFGDYPSYSPNQRYSSNVVERTNAYYLQNTAATRYGITWVNNDGPVNLYYSKGYVPDYSIKLSTTPIGVTVGSGVTIETNGQANFVGVVTATSFSGDGSNLTGVSGFATALSNDQSSPLNAFFKTPKQVNISTGESIVIQSDATSGNVAFCRESIIHVSTGATMRVATGTQLHMNVLDLF